MHQHRVLVCGGRTFGQPSVNDNSEAAEHKADTEAQFIFDKLDLLDKENLIIIQGGARGADRVAKIWAKVNNVTYLTFVADWDSYSFDAGYIRNIEMLEEGKPDLVIVFPGGNGTKMMYDLSCKKSIEVLKYNIETK